MLHGQLISHEVPQGKRKQFLTLSLHQSCGMTEMKLRVKKMLFSSVQRPFLC